jgi:hypothetical protein
VRIGRTVGGLVLGGAAVFAGTQATEDHTTRDEAGDITEAGGLGAYALQVGDCIQLPDADTVISVEGVPCAEPHDAQVFAEFVLPDGDFPGLDAVELAAGEGCYQRWPAAVGTAYESDPASDFTVLTPTAESWAEGDREVTCLLVPLDVARMVGSRLP